MVEKVLPVTQMLLPELSTAMLLPKVDLSPPRYVLYTRLAVLTKLVFSFVTKAS